MLTTKRVYETPKRSDGVRILVDRLWPRGLKKEDAQIDLWLKDIAPSSDLRKWFNHDPKKWPEFKKRYAKELKGEAEQEAIATIKKEAKKKTVTLLYGSKEEEHNNAIALLHFLLKK